MNAFAPPDPATRRSLTHDGVSQDWGDPEGPPDQHHCVVWYKNAAPWAVTTVMAGNTETGDGRSDWYWFRFPDGTLVLGCFPQGDTYFAVEGDHS